MWFYIDNGQQRGPIMDADLDALQRDGKINSETMLWREGMANWQPLREIRPDAGNTSDQPKVPTPAAEAGGGIGLVVCSECGKAFSPSEVIRYGNAAVCAACKPVFVQKLKEGVKVETGPVEYASFWTRFAAYFVDGIITGIIGALLGAVIGVAWGATGGMKSPGGIIGLQLVSMGLGFGVRALYFIYFIGNSGQTPGKKMCKIRVVGADGSPVGYGKATGRFFGYFLSSIILGIGFLMAAWDDEKRALHDRLCNTRVIKL